VCVFKCIRIRNMCFLCHESLWLAQMTVICVSKAVEDSYTVLNVIVNSLQPCFVFYHITTADADGDETLEKNAVTKALTEAKQNLQQPTILRTNETKPVGKR